MDDKERKKIQYLEENFTKWQLIGKFLSPSNLMVTGVVGSLVAFPFYLVGEAIADASFLGVTGVTSLIFSGILLHGVAKKDRDILSLIDVDEKEYQYLIEGNVKKTIIDIPYEVVEEKVKPLETIRLEKEVQEKVSKIQFLYQKIQKEKELLEMESLHNLETMMTKDLQKLLISYDALEKEERERQKERLISSLKEIIDTLNVEYLGRIKEVKLSEFEKNMEILKKRRKYD